MARLSDIEIFVAVVDQGGFTAAAKTLGLSKSYASRRVSALEDRVGAALLTRNTRHVAPTAVGEAFHARCRAALEMLDDAEQIVARELDEPRGRLRISLPGSFGVKHLAGLVASFAGQHPDLSVEASYTDRKVDLVDERYDLVVRIGALPEADLMAKRLASSELWLLASPAYMAEHGTPAEPQDLARHEALIYTLSADPRRWSVPTPNGPESVVVSGRLESDNGDALMAACVAGCGVGYHPSWMALEEVRAGRLVRLFGDCPAHQLGVWALWPRHRHLSPKVARFVRYLADALVDPPWACPAG